MTRPSLNALVRLIQFRSELAIVGVLLGGIALGAAVRGVLPVPGGPSAVSAAPSDPSSELSDHRAPRRPSPSRPATSPDRPPQVVVPR